LESISLPLSLSEGVNVVSNEAVGFALNHKIKSSSNASKVRGIPRYGAQRLQNLPKWQESKKAPIISAFFVAAEVAATGTFRSSFDEPGKESNFSANAMICLFSDSHGQRLLRRQVIDNKAS
jgi:hypothetical protein